jgi:prepilin-type processing-associated H-X9-DG protein
MNNRTVWFCPSATALRENATPVSTSTLSGKVLGYSYKLNNQVNTTPAYFFGSFNGGDILIPNGTATSPTLDLLGMEKGVSKRLNQIISHTVSTATKRQAKVAPAEIWMMSDLDGRNFPSSATGTFGIEDSAIALDQRRWQPVHFTKKRGRNYLFFDGHAEFRFTDMEPVNP